MNCLEMLFFIKKEISYESYFIYSVLRMLSNKQNFTNKYLLKDKLIIKVFFWFNKIKEESLDFLKIFNHLILLWLITVQRIKLTNISSVLNKGIKYFQSILYLNIKNNFFFFNFMNEILLPVIQKNSKRIHYKNKLDCLYSFSDLGSFTNLRLSSNLYLNSVHDKMFLLMKIKNNINLIFYLSCLKI